MVLIQLLNRNCRGPPALLMEAFRPFSNWTAQLQERSGKKANDLKQEKTIGLQVRRTFTRAAPFESPLWLWDTIFKEERKKSVGSQKCCVITAGKKHEKGNLWYLTAQRQKRKTWWYEAPCYKVINMASKSLHSTDSSEMDTLAISLQIAAVMKRWTDVCCYFGVDFFHLHTLKSLSRYELGMTFLSSCSILEEGTSSKIRQQRFRLCRSPFFYSLSSVRLFTSIFPV